MNKFFTNLGMLVVIVFAFCNLLGIQFSQQPYVADTHVIITENANTNADAVSDNVIVTNEKYAAKPEKPNMEINRDCNSKSVANGIINSNGKMEYVAQNKIECNCHIRVNDDIVHNYSKTIVQDFNRLPTHSENDCDAICREICDDFANKIQ